MKKTGDVEALAYEESKRALDQQADVLDALRARTGILLTAISITATFLGARALDLVGFQEWTWAAIAGFAAAGAFSLAVLWPRGEWHFSSNAKVIVENYAEGDNPASLAEAHRELALFNRQRWVENSARLRTLFWFFRLSALSLVLQVAFWLLAFGSSPDEQRQQPRSTPSAREDGARPGGVGNREAPVPVRPHSRQEVEKETSP
jgi:hypothetical protein